MDNDTSSQSKVTLEDILRIKRAERPPQDFWEGFDRELRHKQLAAAIVEERPWWRIITGGLAKMYVPAGALAAVTFALFVARSDRAPSPRSADAGMQDSSMIAVSERDARDNGAAASSSHRDGGANARAARQGLPAQLALAADDLAEADAPLVGQTAEQQSATRTVSDAGAGMLAMSVTSSTATVAAAFVGAKNEFSRRQSLAALQVQSGNEDGIVAKPIFASFGTETEPARAEAAGTEGNDYLHRLASSSNPRSSRLLAYAEPVSESDSDTNDNPRLVRSRERITSRLSDRSLVDSSSRFGAADGMVSIKF